MEPTGTVMVLGTNSRLILIPSSLDITISVGGVGAGATVTGTGTGVCGTGAGFGTGGADVAGIVATGAGIGVIGLAQAPKIHNAPIRGMAKTRVIRILTKEFKLTCIAENLKPT